MIPMLTAWSIIKENWKYCDVVSNTNIALLTRAINGGTHGIEDRKAKTHKYYGWLKE